MYVLKCDFFDVNKLLLNKMVLNTLLLHCPMFRLINSVVTLHHRNTHCGHVTTIALRHAWCVVRGAWCQVLAPTLWDVMMMTSEQSSGCRLGNEG